MFIVLNTPREGNIKILTSPSIETKTRNHFSAINAMHLIFEYLIVEYDSNVHKFQILFDCSSETEITSANSKDMIRLFVKRV